MDNSNDLQMQLDIHKVKHLKNQAKEESLNNADKPTENQSMVNSRSSIVTPAKGKDKGLTEKPVTKGRAWPIKLVSLNE